MNMADKYWETETPKVMVTEKNEVRFFGEAGKVQVYPRISSGRGIGRGATIDLESFTEAELEELKVLLNEVINKRLGGQK